MNWNSELRVGDRQKELAHEAALVRQVRVAEGRSVRLGSRLAIALRAAADLLERAPAARRLDRVRPA